jgi:hypothetical protein
LESALIDKPILVTGIIRSGTTWVGKVLCNAPDTIYLHEPTNPASPWNAAIRTPIQHFYLHESFGGVYQQLFVQMLSLQPRVQGKWLIDHKKWLMDYIQRRRLSEGRDDLRVLIKDPTAIFSTPWMVRNLQIQPIIVLRHPLAIVKSLLRLGWADQFHAMVIVKQPLLINDIYANVSQQDHQMLVSNWRDFNALDRALRWVRIMYLCLVHFKREYPQWDYVCYEKLTQDPLAGFSSMAARHNLRLDQERLERVFASGDNQFDPSAAHQTALSPQGTELAKLFEGDRFSMDWHQHYERWFADLASVFADECEWT